MIQFKLFDYQAVKKPVNVASVPMRSPFRYPGGKTWLIPQIRRWLKSLGSDIILIEPFAGGGIVSLTAAFENLVKKIIMVEKDEDIASVWHTILGKEGKWLAERIVNFDISPENVQAVFEDTHISCQKRAFRTILRNRISHGGILAEGSGFIKKGENGKGLRSRWYAQTLRKRILDIQDVESKIEFIEGDGLEIIKANMKISNAVFFIDPPYVKAARRLYRYFDIDHKYLFELMSRVDGNFLMTYDDVEEIRSLANLYGFEIESVLMKTTHHENKVELLIGRDLSWLRCFEM